MYLLSYTIFLFQVSKLHGAVCRRGNEDSRDPGWKTMFIGIGWVKISNEISYNDTNKK